MNEDEILTGVTFEIDDSDDTLSCTGDVTIQSSNTTLITTTGFVLSGSEPDCEMDITPQANQYGTSTITVYAYDGVTTGSQSFLLTVDPVNDPPTISDVSNQTGTGGVTAGPFAFTINDIDSTLSCTGSMTGESSNSSIMTTTGITFTGTAPNCTVELLAFTGASGVTVVTLIVSDGSLTGADTFNFTVSTTNDAPYVENFDVFITEDTT